MPLTYAKPTAILFVQVRVNEAYFKTNTLIHRSGTSWKTDHKFNTTDAAGTLTHSGIAQGKFLHLGTNPYQQNETQWSSQPDNLTLT